jgi:uncharacterized protein (DUF58 family)
MGLVPNVHVKLNLRLVPAMVAILSLLQFIAPYRGWMILLVAFGAVWLIAFLWIRSLAHGLRFTRETRFGWAHVGDILEERFTLSKNGWLPAVWVEVRDQSNMPDSQVSVGTGISGNTENSWSTRRVCTRRGVFTLGPTTLRAGDPFGVYALTLEYPAFATLVVLPPVVTLPTIQVAPGGRTGEGHRAAHTFERTISVKGLREYVPGDSLSQIHWRSVARHLVLYVRLFEHTPAGDWWIFLDLDRAVQTGADEKSTLECSITLAASLADRGLRAGHAVGLVAHGEQLQRLTPQLGEGARLEILRALALATPGSVPLAELLTHLRPASRQPSSVIIITPSTHPEWIDALSPLMAQDAVPTVLLLDPVSFGGAGNVSNVSAQLGQRGIERYLITREMLRATGARTAHQGDWDWVMSGTGRAVPRHRPLDERWKVLG